MNPYAVSSSSTFKQPHDRFYLLDDAVVLEVGSTVFRLPAFILKNHSSKLRDLIEANQGSGRIELKSISAMDFERLLLVIFPRKIGEYEISLSEEWASVLKTANVLDCPFIQKLAIAQLDSVASAIDRIVLGRQYDFPKLVASGYVELCQREAPITLLEGHGLGMGDVIDISSIRHHLRSPGNDNEIEKTSVLEICSEPGRQVLEHNSVADFVATTFSDTEEAPIPLPPSLAEPHIPAYVPPTFSFQNFVSAASVSPEAGPPVGVGTPVYIIPSTASVPGPSHIAASGPPSMPKQKRKVRSHKGLAKAAWTFKYGQKRDFQVHYKASNPEYKQLWKTEWERHVKRMNDDQAEAFIRTQRIQDLVP